MKYIKSQIKGEMKSKNMVDAWLNIKNKDCINNKSNNMKLKILNEHNTYQEHVSGYNLFIDI